MAWALLLRRRNRRAPDGPWASWVAGHATGGASVAVFDCEYAPPDTQVLHVLRLEAHPQDAGHVAVGGSDNARSPFSRRREDPLDGPLACKGQHWKHGRRTVRPLVARRHAQANHPSAPPHAHTTQMAAASLLEPDATQASHLYMTIVRFVDMR